MKLSTALLLFLISTGILNAQTGGILREYWTNLPGTAVLDLTKNAVFPSSPTGFTVQSAFSAPISWGDNYGTRMRGFIVAPVTGNYIFWICGDDNCELWLSTDKSVLNKTMIARVPGYTDETSWTKYPEQQSPSIFLEAGKSYYIEALQKEGNGGDLLAVGWQLPNGTLERPIGGNRLIPWPLQESYSSWNYSVSVFFNTTETGADIKTDISDFPVLVRLEPEQSNIFQQAQQNGNDVRFADPDGTPLSFEISDWNSSLKKASIWVRVPKITANSNLDYIRMYWGKSDALPKSEPDAVFSYSNNFSNVWHLDDNMPNQKIIDAAGHFAYATFENAGAYENTSSRHTDGIASGALDFNGSNRISLFSFSPIQNDNEFTISAWVYADQVSNTGGVWYTPEWGSFGNVRLYNSTNNWVYENGTGSQNLLKTTPSTASEWTQLSVVQKVGSNMEVFVNGVSKGTVSYPTKGPHGGNSFIGSEEWNNYFDGKIDEVTYSKTARSTDWIKLWYLNQKQAQNFISFSGQVINPPSDLLATVNGNEIVLNWTDNAVNETGFEISRRTGTTLPSLIATVGANTTNYTDPGANCGAHFVYLLKAVNSSSQSSYIESNEIYVAPCKPLALTATQISENEIAITWEGIATEFVLESKLQSVSTYSELYRGGDLLYTHHGITCQSTWDYRIKATNPAGSSEWSYVTVTTGACAITTPEGITADNGTAGQIILSWRDVSTNEDGFRIFRKLKDEANYSAIGTALAASNTFVDNTVACNTTYYYYVTAYNSYSVSAATPSIEVKTLYCGAGKQTSDMLSVNGMYLDNAGHPVTGSRLAVVKLYTGTDLSQLPVYEESFTDIECKNGFFAIPIGLVGDVATIVKSFKNLYFDVIIDGTSMFGSKAQPLTASPYSIKNSFNLAGVGSPIILKISAPIGATWVDTGNRLLYVKYGVNDMEWKQIGN